MKRSILLATLVAVLLGALVPVSALAAAPGNDAFANATVIDPATLPFSDVVDNTDATTELGEVDTCGYPTGHSLWYRFTASTNTFVRFDMNGTYFYNRKLDVFQAGGPTIGDLSLLGCAGFGDSFVLHPAIGATYYVRIEDLFGSYGILQLNAASVLPPSNDAFANATPIGALPFSSTIDMTASSTEAAEPVPTCVGAQSGQSAWYVYDAPTTGSVSASFTTQGAAVGMYTGTALATLQLVGCAPWSYSLSTVHVDAGSRYYFQVFGGYVPLGSSTFQLQVAPAVLANFSYYPFDPSTFDAIQFQGSTADPANVGISSWAWTFGDGSTASVPYPQHQYARDGDYTVRSTVGTPDGRTATDTQVVHVRTHDVSIAKFTVPTSAGPGQTRSITVGLSNARYAEQVQVSLFKLTPGGPVQIGTSNQLLPVRSGNRTTDVTFSYTFTSDDARIGKVSFQAVVSLGGVRDAIPGDNQAQSLPTKVNK
jgi:hypothetical protein